MAALQAVGPSDRGPHYTSTNSKSFHELVTAERETCLTDINTFTFFYVDSELLATFWTVQYTPMIAPA